MKRGIQKNHNEILKMRNMPSVVAGGYSPSTEEV